MLDCRAVVPDAARRLSSNSTGRSYIRWLFFFDDARAEIKHVTTCLRFRRLQKCSERNHQMYQTATKRLDIDQSVIMSGSHLCVWLTNGDPGLRDVASLSSSRGAADQSQSRCGVVSPSQSVLGMMTEAERGDRRRIGGLAPY